MSEFPIVPSKTGLLFFDTLNHYLHPNGPDSQPDAEAAGFIQKLVRINQACRSAGVAVFYGQADHRPDGRDFTPLVVDRGFGGRRGEPPRLSSPPGVTGGGWRAEVIPEIAPQPGDYAIKKHRWDTFHQTHFELSLRTAGIDTLMLAGGATEIGIASTAYSGRDRDFNQIILRDACKGMTTEGNDFFMDHVFPVFARVMTVDQVVEMLAKRVAH